MLRQPDVEELCSVAILGISFALVTGVILEKTNYYSEGTELGATVAGAIVLVCGIGVIIYVFMNSESGSVK